jgi:hypothetical protein
MGYGLYRGARCKTAIDCERAQPGVIASGRSGAAENWLCPGCWAVR